jgi:hypothetical protein
VTTEDDDEGRGTRDEEGRGTSHLIHQTMAACDASRQHDVVDFRWYFKKGLTKAPFLRNPGSHRIVDHGEDES